MKSNKIVFEYEYYPEMDMVRQHIKKCESFHSQQVAYSSFHNALTQICFHCKKIRTNLKIN
jgi:hypothetical protein